VSNGTLKYALLGRPPADDMRYQVCVIHLYNVSDPWRTKETLNKAVRQIIFIFNSRENLSLKMFFCSSNWKFTKCVACDGLWITGAPMWRTRA